MKARKMRQLEDKLIEALQNRFGDPESEAPTTLRDQPNEIVYTALQPKKRPEERAGMMGYGNVPTITVDPAEEMFQEPRSAGSMTMESMMGAGGQAAPQPAAAALPEPSPAPGPTQAQPAPQQAPASEEEMLQDLLVTG